MNHLNPFWKDVFVSLSDFRNIVCENILTIPVWFNENIRIDKNELYIQGLFFSGMAYIDDCVNENLNVLNLDELKIKFKTNIHFTTFLAIIRQIKVLLKDLIQVEKSQRPIIPKYLSIILSKRKGCRDIYDKFVSVQRDKLKCELKWENILNIYT